MTIKQEVEQWLSEKEEPDYPRKKILEGLQQNGCISGMVSSLIYHTDCVAFVNKHWQEVEEIINEMKENYGTYDFLANKNDSFSFSRMAWICFEYRANEMLNEMEGEE